MEVHPLHKRLDIMVVKAPPELARVLATPEVPGGLLLRAHHVVLEVVHGCELGAGGDLDAARCLGPSLNSTGLLSPRLSALKSRKGASITHPIFLKNGVLS